MFLAESIKLALDTLRAHKLRSFLTLLGVIIAVTTLIAVVSIIEGMNRYIADRIANLGSNVFIVTRFGIITSAKAWAEAQKRRRLTMDDYLGLRTSLKLAGAVGAVSWRPGDVKAGNQSLYDVSIQGVTPNIINIGNPQVDVGRYISETDFEHHTYSAFVGRDVTDSLFPSANPLGKTIRLMGQEFEVVGVAKRIGTVFGQSQDNFMLIPLTTFLKMYGHNPNISISIEVQALEPQLMSEAQDEARLQMRARHHLRFGDKDDFGIISSDTIYSLWESLTSAIAAVAVGVTSVFLVVGGIVIMNIMLASVTERTHEIGIRKSLGARRKDILLQFLVESAALSTAGGMIGVLIAWIGTQIMGTLTSIPSALPLAAVVTAVLVSAAVGLFFGIYPASKAARLDPIEALRAE